MKNVNPAAYGIATFAALERLGWLLVDKGILTKEELSRIYSEAAQANFAQGQAAPSSALSPSFSDAGDLLASAGVDVDNRF